MSKKLNLLTITGMALLLLPMGLGMAQTNSTSPLSNTVIEIDGSALIHREGWNSNATEPLTMGEIVGTNDVIMPVDFGQVTILCADGTTSIINQMSGTPSCGPALSSATDLSGAALSGTRSPINTPTIISPVGKIANTRPSFRWTPIDKANNYTLRITTLDSNSKVMQVWMRANLSSTTYSYPTDVPPLVPGDYTITVSAFAGKQELDKSALTDEITVVPQSDVDNLKAEFAKISSAITDANISKYMQARLYASDALYSDAILMLESALNITSDSNWVLPDPQGLSGLAGSPMPYMLLGDWYDQLGVTAYAQQFYQAALDVANTRGKPTAAAQARIALAQYQSFQVARYCLVQPAVDALQTIDGSDVLLKQAEDIASDAQTLLGFTPTCST